MNAVTRSDGGDKEGVDYAAKDHRCRQIGMERQCEMTMEMESMWVEGVVV